MKIAYARVSTAAQDSSIRVGLLVKEDVERDQAYVDHGLSGRQTRRPALDNAISAYSRISTDDSAKNEVTNPINPCRVRGVRDLGLSQFVELLPQLRRGHVIPRPQG